MPSELIINTQEVGSSQGIPPKPQLPNGISSRCVEIPDDETDGAADNLLSQVKSGGWGDDLDGPR